MAKLSPEEREIVEEYLRAQDILGRLFSTLLAKGGAEANTLERERISQLESPSLEDQESLKIIAWAESMADWYNKKHSEET